MTRVNESLFRIIKVFFNLRSIYKAIELLIRYLSVILFPLVYTRLKKSHNIFIMDNHKSLTLMLSFEVIK